MADIDLTPDLDRFVRSQVDAGRYRDPSEVIAAGLLLLEEAIATQTGHRDHLLASIAAAYDDPDPGVTVALAFDRLEERHVRRMSNGGEP